MKILYLGCHRTLEFDEVSLFSELGHSIICYRGPDLNLKVEQRPVINNVTYVDRNIFDAGVDDKDIEDSDVIYITQFPQWVLNLWPKIKNKIVVLRLWESNVGYNTLESLDECRRDGLIIVRFSPLTVNYGFNEKDSIIRFYKDPNEFNGWNGIYNFIINITKDMAQREPYCHYSTYQSITAGLPRKLFGTSTESSGIQGGELTYELLKQELRNNVGYLYTGTWPAPYTLNFIEAWITGIPIISIGQNIANLRPEYNCFEVSDFIVNGVNGFISNDPAELRKYCNVLLNDHEFASHIGKNGRASAIKIFGKETIKIEWNNFFNSLK